MRSLITFLMIFHFSITLAQQASEYKGTSYQNVKLFKVRPDLRGKSFENEKGDGSKNLVVRHPIDIRERHLIDIQQPLKHPQEESNSLLEWILCR